VRAVGSIPGLGGSPGGGHDNPLQYSCLQNPMDRGSYIVQETGIKAIPKKKKCKKAK